MDTITSTTLLEGLEDANNERAWQCFSDRYRPLLVGFGLRVNLDLEDAQDLAQETLLSFMQSYSMGKYDRSKGRLRSWLYGIFRRNFTDFIRKREREASHVRRRQDTGFWSALASSEEFEAAWEEEWKQGVFRACVDEISRKLSPRTFTAFELYFLREWSVERVADHLKMSVGGVYKAKHTAMNKIRAIRVRMEEIW